MLTLLDVFIWTSMSHQVLEEHNCTDHKQGDTKLLKLLNEYLLMGSTAKTVGFEMTKNTIHPALVLILAQH